MHDTREIIGVMRLSKRQSNVLSQRENQLRLGVAGYFKSQQPLFDISSNLST